MTQTTQHAIALKGVPAFPAKCPAEPASAGPDYIYNDEDENLHVTIGWSWTVPIKDLINGPEWYTDEFWTKFGGWLGTSLDHAIREHLSEDQVPDWWSAIIMDAWEYAAGKMADHGTPADRRRVARAIKIQRLEQELDRARAEELLVVAHGAGERLRKEAGVSASV